MASNRNRTTTRPAPAAEAAVPTHESEHIVPKSPDPHQFITVKNGVHGTLVYRSVRTGELFTWDRFGAEQEMELQELRKKSIIFCRTVRGMGYLIVWDPSFISVV